MILPSTVSFLACQKTCQFPVKKRILISAGGYMPQIPSSPRDDDATLTSYANLVFWC